MMATDDGVVLRNVLSFLLRSVSTLVSAYTSYNFLCVHKGFLFKSKKTYPLMTYPPNTESRYRQKENKNQTLLSSQNHLSRRSLTDM